ncbi:phage minor head protein [Segnochrobactrum spirostomi]|uniref:phage minor head protein n=1 Tax=Segnochrobactrum spirostomi TaxID=2608987 RepID=UPI001AD82197|nr:phage minor head protein [Segnochrobactrum spirostomi]
MTTVSDALGLPPVEAIDYLRRRTAIPSRTYRDVWRDANARAFTVAGAATQALAADFQAEIVRAAETGSTLRDFEKTFDALVAKHGWAHSGSRDFRARVIYETNLSTAYAAGRYRQMVEPETLAAFPFWEYVHGGSKHPRHDHLSWNGVVLRCDDPWWDSHYPPNGWGCSCWVRPLSARALARRGKDGPDVAPPIEYRDWTNKTTGKVEQVPRGIDPGWNYNVGQAYVGTGPVKMPTDATLKVGRPLGARLPKPAASPLPAARPAAAPTRRADDELTTVIPPGRASGAPIPPQPAAAPEEVRRFGADVLSGAITDRDRSVIVAHIDDAMAGALETEVRAVELSAFRVAKVAGLAEQMGGVASTAHPEITPEMWGRLVELIERGEVYHAAGRYRQILVHGDIDGRSMMAIIRVASTPDGGERLIVPTYSQSGRRRFARLTRGMTLVRPGQ